MTYQTGQEVVWLHDGQEFPATVLNCGMTHDEVEFYHIEVEGIKKHARLDELLAAKKAGFEIRDLAFVLDEGRDAIQGEIVAIGLGPKNRAFYQLRFEPAIGRAESWYSENEVFTVSSPSADSEVGSISLDESQLMRQADKRFNQSTEYDPYTGI